MVLQDQWLMNEKAYFLQIIESRPKIGLENIFPFSPGQLIMID